ncbi:MAG: reverse gyrase [Desulfurococcaceae archaeon]
MDNTANVSVEVKHPVARGIYRHACPNCGGSISDERLLLKAPCEACLPEEEFKAYVDLVANADKSRRLKIYYSLVHREGRLKELVEEETLFRKFELFFQKATNGFMMWSAQKAWAKRLLRGESFSIIAPTGMGKTVFSLIATLYKVQEAKKSGRKIYIAFPTTPLLLQAWKKLLQFAENSGIKICSNQELQSSDECVRVLCIHGKLNKKDKELYMEMVVTGSFDILLSTSAFLHKHADKLPRGVYELVIMDDVDAILRSGKAVRRLLNLIGIDDAAIDKGLQVIKLKARLSMAQGEEFEKLKVELSKLQEEINSVKKSIKTTLIVNSATGKPRGIYPKLFKLFLNFEAGSKPEAIRNIVDAYVIPEGMDLDKLVVELCLKLKDGIIVFVPADKGVEYAEQIAQKLREAGLSVEAFHAKKSIKIIEEFSAGNLNALVGVATYYGTIVRGLDLPERVKFVVFTGVPRHKFSSKLEKVSPIDILRMLVVVRDIVEGDEKSEIETLIGKLARKLRSMSPGALAKVKEIFNQVTTTGLKGDEPSVVVDLYKAYNILKKKLEEPAVWEKLTQLGEIAITKENEEMYLLIPDVATYIQASGRCSRLYPGGITKGLSVVIVDDARLLSGLTRRMRWIFEDFKMVNLHDLDLDKLVKEISEERLEVQRIIRGEVKPDKYLDLVKTAVLIVESPNKAKTIANFFGKPSVRVLGEGLQAYEITVGNHILTVIASGGHVYDLIIDEEPPEAEKHGHLYGVALVQDTSEQRRFIPIYTDIKTCINGHQFSHDAMFCPRCKSSIKNRKLSVIEVLKRLASEVDVVFIGTDPDSEGEKIAWDLRVLLEPYAEKIQRVEFHEVTRRAIMEALLNPRDFNARLVEAQIVRRVEDRWLGFSLSKIVQEYGWLKYCMSYLYRRHGKPGKIESIDACCYPNRNLSAGRVQTPVLGFIISEYHKSKRPENRKYQVYINVERHEAPLILVLNYNDALKAGIIDEHGKVVNYPNVEVVILEERENEVNPPSPFTTDTLLEDASRIYGFSTTKTMNLAQELFEMGLITYHRTDSTRVSDVGIEVARQYLEDKYGAKYTELFKPRTWGVGGAHEAIRPTRPIDADRLSELVKEGAIVVVGRLTRDHMKLYDLIFRRFIASQMKPARVKIQKLKVCIGELEQVLEVVTSIVEKGYLELYENLRVQAEELGTPGEKLSGFISNVKKLKYPLPKYHDVIKWMKENGIGRPSTYAKIVQTLIDRRYVKATEKTKSLLALERGIQIYDFLNEFFRDIVGVEVTRKLEENMDKIERGELYYQKLLNQLYEEVQERILSEEMRKSIENSLKLYIDECRDRSSSPLS